MPNNILLNTTMIDEAYLAAYSPIPINYKWDDIRPFVLIAQEIWAKDILGIPLYEDILREIKREEISESNSSLLLKLYPYLSLAVVYEALPFLNAHITEKGITKGKSDNSEPITNAELTNMKTHIRSQLEVLKKMFKVWLNENAECFPSYIKDECEYDECDITPFAYFIYNGGTDFINRRNIKWMNFYNKIKSKPNANLRLFSSNGNFR